MKPPELAIYIPTISVLFIGYLIMMYFTAIRGKTCCKGDIIKVAHQRLLKEDAFEITGCCEPCIRKLINFTKGSIDYGGVCVYHYFVNGRHVDVFALSKEAAIICSRRIQVQEMLQKEKT